MTKSEYLEKSKEEMLQRIWSLECEERYWSRQLVFDVGATLTNGTKAADYILACKNDIKYLAGMVKVVDDTLKELTTINLSIKS